MRRDVILDLVLTDQEGLIGDVKVGGLCCSDYEMIECRILRGGRKTTSRIAVVDSSKTSFGLFKVLL